jgi:diguanylate cyclase (GGDEF)-like protein
MSQILETNTSSDRATGVAQSLAPPVAPSSGSTQESDAPVSEAPTAPVTLTAAFAETWQRLQGTIEARLAILDDATTAVLDGTLEDSLRQQAEHEARKLAGSIGVFGFVQGAQLAREIERLFAARPSADSTQTLRLAEVVVLLRTQLEQAPILPQSSQPEALRVSSVLIIDEDQEWAEQVTLDALTQGLRVTVAPNLATAQETVSSHAPDALVVNLAKSRDPDAWLTLLVTLEDCARPVPIIVLADEDTLAHRLEATQLGGQSFLLKPWSSLPLFHVVRQFILHEQTVEARVLAVVDDPEVQVAIRTALDSPRFALHILATPHTLIEALEEHRPDVLILDADIRDGVSIPLCHVVRSDPHWGGLPILVFAAQPAADTVHRMFSAGADDLIYKPLVTSELAAHVVRRAARVRQSLANSEIDSLTGTMPRQRAHTSLERLFRLASRYQQPFSLAHVAFDQAEQCKDQHGITAWKHGLRLLGQFLLESFRTEDVIIRWTPTQFVIAGYGLSRADGVQRLAETLEMFRRAPLATQNGPQLSVTFSAGIAQYPGDGNDITSLCQAAELALRHAQEAGGDRIVPTGWQQEASQHADVLVLDEDAPLAGLLLHALQTRGYHAQWLRDGQEAVETLCGEAPRLKARVILLDLGLPSLDGLTVLRQLAQDNVLQETRAIVLTARAAEAEIVEALELGAVDYVTKPFSMPVLMRRIRRELHK